MIETNQSLAVGKAFSLPFESALLSWSEAAAAGPEICGGKGFNLGRLARYGFRVPRGGVIPAQWYAKLIAFAPAHAMKLVQSVPGESATDPAVAAALAEIRYAIETAELPPAFVAALAAFLRRQGLLNSAVAVRSSATAEDSARASFAGIHHSVLQVRGLEAIARGVLKCYASLWTPQALAYRRRMNFADTEVQCAVVICEMVRAEGAAEPQCAGVGFTFDPLTGRRDLIVIDGARGCGEAVVSGLVDPQRIVFRNIRGRLHPHSRSEGQALLPPERERELAHLLFRLHWAFGDGQDPQDVEWAFDGNEFWILQVRPATNVRRCMPAAIASEPRHWSTANIKDAVPGVVCTLSWSLLKDAVDTIAFAAPIAAGYELPSGAELIRRFQGRAYFELSLMQWVLFDALGITPAQVVKSIGGQPEIAIPDDPAQGRNTRRRVASQFRLMRRLLGIEQELTAIVSKRDERLKEIQMLALQDLSASGLLSVFDKLVFEYDSIDLAAGLANSAEGPWEMALEAVLKPVFGERGRSLMGGLLAGSGSVTSAEHGYAILQLATTARKDEAARAWLNANRPGTEWMKLPKLSLFRARLASFLEKYGHRGVYEADYLNPRWAEDPSYILDQVRFALENPEAHDPREAAERVREDAEISVERAMPWRAPIVGWLAGRLRDAMAIRESAKSALIASAFPSKRVALEIGRRLVSDGRLDHAEQVLHLAMADIVCWLEGWWDGAGARELAVDRASQREAWLAEETPPDVITEEADGRTHAEAASPVHEGDVWTGIGAAPGVARGVARIIRHPNEGHLLAKGEVLVAPSTDPGWTPLFLRASAIVMASGGYLSHGAIVAREYGIPAVVNLPGILADLRDGDRLVVDGDTGCVMREPG